MIPTSLFQRRFVNMLQRLHSLRHKLLAAFISLTVTLVTLIAAVSFYSARNALRSEAFAGMQALRESRSEQLLLWFQDRQREVLLLAANPTVEIAANSLINSLERPISATQTPVELMREMVTRYRGQPDLRFAGDASIYSAVHNRIHLFFQHILKTWNYVDILLISPSGNVVYSVQKRADVGTNVLRDAPDALKTLHETLMQATQADVTRLTDMTTYPPAAQVVMFAGAPIFSGTQIIGTLMLELPVSPLNHLLTLREGLGRTGESYIVGRDHLFRSESRFLHELGVDSTILRERVRVETEAVRAAFQNISSTRIINGYMNKSVVSTWQPVMLQPPSATDPQGLEWTLIIEKQQAEVEAPAHNLLRSVVIVAIVVSIVSLGMGYLFADRLARPIQQLSQATRQLAGGSAATLPVIVSRDEIGALANDFQMLIDVTDEIARVAKNIADGNLQIEARERSADDRMMQALNGMIRTLNAMMQETDSMIHAAQDGNIAIRSNADAYHGAWRQLFEGVNALLNTLSGAVAQSAALTQEMELARRIQTAILPNNMAYDGFDIEAVMLPADEVGGDYYDVLTGSDGALWLAIGDVSGHGVTPGLVMMIAQTIHATIATQYPATPKQVIETVNRVLFQSVHDRLHADHFMTFTTLKYEGSGRFTHAGAHLDLIVHRQATQLCELIDTSGVFLNFIPEIAHATTNASFTLDVGDTLILYTDGLTEAWNADKVMLDVSRFVEIVRRHAGNAAAAMRDAIMRDVLEWCGNRRDDDMSLVIVRRTHKKMG